MNLITREQLKEKINRGEEFRLVNCLEAWMFDAKHIPGSIRFDSLKQALSALDPKEEIIVYCSNPGCTASALFYQQLVEHGFGNVKRYEGGVADWEDAGYPFAGKHVTGTE